MTTLTETAHYTKRFFLYFGIFILAIIILKFSWDISASFLPQKPPPQPVPPQPTVTFGKIPAPVFPLTATSSASFTYQIETLSGLLPELPTVVKVYSLPKQQITFLSLDRAKILAKKLGFEAEHQQVSEEEYLWQDQTLPRILRMNIITQNFITRYDLSKDSSPFEGKESLTVQGATSEAQRFLQATELSPKDLAISKTSFWRWEEGNLKEVFSLSQAQAIRVDFPRQNLEDLPVLAANPNQPQISILVTASQDYKKKILATNYTYWQIDLENSATYPLKSVKLAFGELQQGKAVVVSFSEGSQKILIREIYLAYFEPETYQPYLQPIFVFKGDNNFAAYVSAVSLEWLK